MSRQIKLPIFVLALIVAPALASAEPSKASEAEAIAGAKVPLSAAIAAAEKHAQGKAIEAEFEAPKEGPAHYEVEVAVGSKEVEVKVDAEKGTIIASKEDKEAEGDKDD